jgi:hypothetical protein
LDTEGDELRVVVVRCVTEGLSAVLLTAGGVDLWVVVERWDEEVFVVVLLTSVVAGLRVVVARCSAGRFADDLSDVAVVVVLRVVVVCCPADERVPVLFAVTSVDLRVVSVPLVAVLILCAGCAVVLLCPLAVEAFACDLAFRSEAVLA